LIGPPQVQKRVAPLDAEFCLSGNCHF